MQKKYFREEYGVLEPVEIKMGERTVLKSGLTCFKHVPAFGYCVPFLKSLEQLLAITDVQEMIVRGSQSTMRDMFDFEDGEFCREHSVFSQSDNNRILAYFDDIKVVNPIGGHAKKHKLSLFFWQLLNIPPVYRSRLANIQLIAVAKAKDCKDFGLGLLLNDFISGINMLHNIGIKVCVGGTEKIIKGGL